MFQQLLYNKNRNYSHILIGSHLIMNYWRTDAHMTSLTFLFFITKYKNIPCCHLSLFSNRSQKTPNCGKNISDTLGCHLDMSHVLVLNTVWRHQWCITEQIIGNVWQHGTNCVLSPQQRRKECCNNSLIKTFKFSKARLWSKLLQIESPHIIQSRTFSEHYILLNSSCCGYWRFI